MVQDPVRPVIYATTSANSVIAINTGTMAMSELFIGSNPEGLDISADGSRLYVANSGSTVTGIGVVDLTTFQALPSLPTPFAVTSVAAGLNGRLYITSGAQGSAITQIDGGTGAVQTTISPQTVQVYSGKLRCSPDRKTLYYGDFGESAATLYAIDVSGATPVLSQTGGSVGENGEDLAITPDGSALVYPNGAGQGNYGIYLIPTNNINGILGSFNVGAYPKAGAFSPDGATFYASQYGLNGEVQLWSTSTFREIGSFAVPQLGALLADQTGKYLFAAVDAPASGGTGSLTVYATGAGAYPLITSASNVNIGSGVATSFALTSTENSVTWTATGLPSGLTVGATNGIVSGTASGSGSYTAQVTATKAGGGSQHQVLTIHVQPIPSSIVSLGTQLATFGRSIVEMVRDPNRPLIYATTTDNTVIALNTNTLLIAAEIWIGSNPAGLSISPDGTRLYVANSGSTVSGVGIVDLTTLQALPSFSTPFQVDSLAAGLNGRLYILGDELLQVDASNGTVEATVLNPQEVYSGKLAITPDFKKLVYGNFGLSPSTLYEFDVSSSTPALTQTSAFGTLGSNGQDVVLTADGTALVYPNGGGQGNYQIFLIPTTNLNSVLGKFNTQAYPTDGAFSPDGGTFYTSPSSSNTLQVWNTTTFLETASFSTPELGRLLVDSLGKYIFAVSYPSSTDDPSTFVVYSTGTRTLPTITSPSTFTVDEGAAVQFTLTSKETGVTWSGANLPSGLSLDPQTGALSGSIAVPGNYPIQVTASDQSGGTAQATLTVTVLTQFTVQINGQGTVTGGTPGTVWAPIGSAYMLTAVPTAGNLFTGWTGSRSAATATLSGVATADMTFTANFAPATTLTVAVSGPGTVTPGYAGVTSHAVGSTVTIAASPNAGARFTGWTGDVTSSAASLSVTLNQPTNLTANFATIIYPIVTSPASLTVNEGAPINFALASAETGVTWSATNLPSGATLDAQTGLISGSVATPGNYTARVTATDQLGTTAQASLTIAVLTRFTVEVNGQGTISGSTTGATWVPIGSTYSLTAAALSDAIFTGWTGSEVSQSGTISGAVTADMTLTANFTPSVTLRVAVADPGTVPAEFAGTTVRAIGSSVTIQASASAGAAFTGWSGDIVSPQASLTFTLSQATTIVANFATVDSFAGSYVFSAATPTAPGPQTRLAVSMNADGFMTGKLTDGGQPFGFAGSFTPAGNYVRTFNDKHGESVGLQLTVSMPGGHPEVTGIVTQGGNSYNLHGYRLESVPAGQTVLQAGRYTFLLPPPTGTNSDGYGYGRATVSKSGAAIFAGVMGDGTAFSAGARLTDAGFVAMNASLYGNKGYLSGFLQFRDIADESDFDGTLIWSQPLKVGARVAPNGRQTSIAAVGSTFLVIAKGGSLFTFTTATLTFSNGGLTGQSRTTVTIGAGNKVTTVKPDSNAVTCTLNAKTGAFTGSFAPSGTKARRGFNGVIFEKNPSAAGSFQGIHPGSHGAALLTPSVP